MGSDAVRQQVEYAGVPLPCLAGNEPGGFMDITPARPSPLRHGYGKLPGSR